MTIMRLCGQLLLLLSLVSLSSAVTTESPAKSRGVLQFKTLDGSKQVASFFNVLDRGFFSRLIHEADLRIEHDILVTSPDPRINQALALEVKHPNVERASYAIYLICMRARFVPRSEFPIKQVSTDYFNSEREGRVSPFLPNFDTVGKEAREAIQEVLRSSNSKLKATARLYSGELEKELNSLPTVELVHRWRTEVGKLPAPIYYKSDPSDRGELVRILTRVLGSKGLEAAVSVSEILNSESKPWAREQEIELLQLIDAGAVRLRCSQQGKEVIRVIKDTLAKRVLGPAYKTAQDRQEYWKLLERQFFQDHLNDLWLTLIGRAFDEYFGEHTGGIAIPLRRPFIAYLTEIDPTFPSWEFPSTTGDSDVLHPRFKEKIARYHVVFVAFMQDRTHVKDQVNMSDERN